MLFQKVTEFYSTPINEGSDKIQVHCFGGLLVDYVKRQIAALPATRPDKPHDVFLIKDLRNGIDFEYEKSMLYWNEDLGLTIPTFYVISDRKLTHVSSSAIRGLEKFK